MPPTKTKIRSYFRRDIQGLRALAVVLVVLYHSRFSIPHTLEFGGGFVGVDVFFVISGFVVGGLLWRQIETDTRIDFVLFFKRRARRLLPALGALLAIVVVVSLFILPIQSAENVSWTAISAALFSANIYLFADSNNYFAADASLNPLLHTWSLSVEEQFYALLAVLFATGLAVAQRSGRSRQHVIVGITLTGMVLSFAYSVASVSANAPLAFFSPFSRAWEFFVGVLLYIVATKIPHQFQSNIAAGLLALAGVGLIFYASVFFSTDTAFPGVAAAVPVGGAAIIILAGSVGPNNVLSRFLGNKLFVAMGNISYGWYLWHWPAIVFGNLYFPGNDEIALLLAFGSIIPAWVSAKYLEKSSASVSRSTITRPQLTKVLMTGLALPVVAALLMLVLENRAFHQLTQQGSFIATIKENQRQIESSVSSRGAPDQTPPAVIVMGDSHAATLFGGLSRHGESIGVNVGLISQGKGCLTLVGPWTGRADQACDLWQVDALQTVTASDAQVVVLHGYATGRLSGFKRGQSSNIEMFDESANPVETPGEAIALYQLGLQGAVDEIVRSGKRVLLISSVPDFGEPLPTSVSDGQTSVLQVLLGNHPTITLADLQHIAISDAIARNKPFSGVEEEIARKNEKVDHIDLTSDICRHGFCVQWRDGVLLYSDLDHITQLHADELAPTIFAVLMPHLGSHLAAEPN